MGKVTIRNQPCLDKTCGSSDARQIYETGNSFCFSCREWFPPQKEGEMVIATKEENFVKSVTLDEIKTFQIRGFKERLIQKSICEFFEVKVSYDPDSGEIDAHYYPYGDGAYKVRRLPKHFYWIGKSIGLFGRDKFPNGGKRLIITEGEIDALSVAQASFDKYERIYPVVALSSASIVNKSLMESREWLRSFDEVVLMLDNDEAGRVATEEAIRIIGVDKVKLVTLPCKDPNEVLLKFGTKRLWQLQFEAASYVPSGIIGKEELWEKLKSYNNLTAVPYPDCLRGVNSKLKGMRVGEITLFVSGTGAGKSTILREIMLDILKTTPDKIGVVSLEESPEETARKLAGMAINRNPEHEEIPIDDLKVGFDEIFGTDRVILLDHQGSIDDSSIVDKLEYMCLSGAKYLFIDHITILVSEGVEDLTGNAAQDKIMNDLLRLVKRHSAWICLVSHLRKSIGGSKSFEEGRLPSIDDIRGSGSIKQISFDIVAFARNLVAANETERNTIKMQVLKARTTGLTGPIKGAFYDYPTGRLLLANDADTGAKDDNFTAIAEGIPE